METRYEASWESLVQYPVPEWALDAKFGIYAHWGVYSVPAFGNEWYARNMYREGTREHEHFTTCYGELSTKGYKDLISGFTAEHFDPDEWADLIAYSGAKFGGISLVHHDGFLLWDCKLNRWNAKNMGPKRDLYGELVGALRDRGLRISATFHHFRTFDWYLPGSGGLGEAPPEELISKGRAEGWDLFDPEYADLYWNAVTGKYDDFVAEWKAEVKEVIDRYHPDLMWFDGGRFREEESAAMVCELLAHYINQGLDRGAAVAILNKLPSVMKFNFPRELGLLTFEQGRDRLPGIERPWIDDINIADRAWGYIEGQTYRSASYVINALADSVSRGGGVFLSLAPRADGSLPEEQVRTLRGVGNWMQVNGEAIFGTRPWRIQTEGDTRTVWPDKLRTPWNFHNCGASDIRYTHKGDSLYAIALGWPDGGQLDLAALGDRTYLGEGSIGSVRLLGVDKPLSWTRDLAGLHITLPAEKPHDHAYAFKIENVEA